jgi:hypothetical protein
MIKEGKIKDGKTIAAVGYYLLKYKDIHWKHRGL